jgi:transcriptional regulator with XRE-family HTH domain
VDQSPASPNPATRFHEFLEHSGLSREEAAERMGVTTHSIWDLKTYANELITVYSPDHLRRFARILAVSPLDFFDAKECGPPVSPAELAQMIRVQCQSRNVTLVQFEDIVGWRLNECMDPPERLLTDMSVDGLQRLCRELNLDWLRVINAL